jgi:nucleoside-diphosphate-sugar epimerase
MSKVKRVIILGNSGFIGSKLNNMLLQTGAWEVVGLSKRDIDLTDSKSIRQIEHYFLPDSALVFAAAIKRQFGDDLDAYRQNMAIVENVCRLLEINPIKRVVFFSSAAVYGEETENISISEKTPINPTSFYGIAKYSAERLLKKVCEENRRTSLVCLRPPLVYGKGDQGRTYGPSGFLAAAEEGKPITLWGDGTELREFVYVDDICRLVALLLSIEFSGELNAISGTRYCFADIIGILKKHFPALEVDSKPRSKQKVDNAFDFKKMKSLLPADYYFTSLENGLFKMLKKQSSSDGYFSI